MTERKIYLVIFSAYSKNFEWDNQYYMDLLTEKEIIESAYLDLEREEDSEGEGYCLESYTDMKWIDMDSPEYDEERDTDGMGGHYDRDWREGEKFKAAVECLRDDDRVYMTFDPSTELDLFKKYAAQYFTEEDINEFLVKQEIIKEEK